MTVVVAVAVAGLVAMVVVFVAFGQSTLHARDTAACEALEGVEVQLARRADLLATLGATVAAYAAAERVMREEVRWARTEVQQATTVGTVADKARAAHQLEDTVERVLAVAEGHPDLHRSTGFQRVSAQLADAEAQLGHARQRYDEAVAALNDTVEGIPWGPLAGFAGVGRRPTFTSPSAPAPRRAVRF